MDSRRPQALVTLPVTHLRGLQRAGRAFKRFVVIFGSTFVVGNLALLVLPFPHVHFCMVPLALVSAPVVAVYTFRQRAVLGESSLPCPRCGERIEVPKDLPGWPARFNCVHCGIMVELHAAQATGPSRGARAPDATTD